MQDRYDTTDSAQAQRLDSSSSPSSSQRTHQKEGVLRRKKEQSLSGEMGEGFYISVDESAGNESPKKRARTGSLSDHGTSPKPNAPASAVGDLL